MSRLDYMPIFLSPLIVQLKEVFSSLLVVSKLPLLLINSLLLPPILDFLGLEVLVVLESPLLPFGLLSSPFPRAKSDFYFLI